MDIQKQLVDHYQRWGLDSSPEEQFIKFKNRVISATDDVIGKLFVKQSEIDAAFSQICQQHCANEPLVKTSQTIPKFANSKLGLSAREFFALPTSYEVTVKGFGDTCVYKQLKNANDHAELITILQIIFWVIEEKIGGSEYQNELIKRLRDAAKLTPLMQFNVASRGKVVVIYPSGEKFLDEGITDYVIFGLEKYPDIAKSFKQALAFYQAGDTSTYRNLLDNLRFTLEQLLKKILENNKPIEKQRDDLLPWLKQKGINTYLINIYAALLDKYNNYQNNAVKHHSEPFSNNEVEFMIYLTGTFIRLILQLADESTNNVSH
jgi:hypothetical protein